MVSQENPYPLRVERSALEKIRYIAKRNSRSINKEIEFLINQHIESYEKEHGPIAVSKE